MINYHDKKFSSIKSIGTGEVDATTIFHYRQEGNTVWATYKGGAIRMGTLLAQVDTDGKLNMIYQQLNTTGEFRTGKCISTPEILADGRIRLHEVWQWTNGDLSKGESIIEEIVY
ncbi:MAG TPA: n-acetylglutamate synthase [Saprospiraceae bacterium]|nr:n-acetylglutamate synthase [Saprospiraceae bacterium]